MYLVIGNGTLKVLAGQVTETKQFSDREIRWVSPQEFSDYPLAKPQQKKFGRLIKQLLKMKAYSSHLCLLCIFLL